MLRAKPRSEQQHARGRRDAKAQPLGEAKLQVFALAVAHRLADHAAEFSDAVVDVDDEDDVAVVSSAVEKSATFRRTKRAAPDAELVTWARRVARTEGIALCPEAAACLAALHELVTEGALGAGDRVVVFNTGAAQKHVEALDVELPQLGPPDGLDWEAVAEGLRRFARRVDVSTSTTTSA